MAISLITALAVAGAAIAGAATATAVGASNKPEPPKAPALPSAPSPDKANRRAEDAARRRRAAQSQTVFTSPLGIGGQAQVARKTLTGQ